MMAEARWLQLSRGQVRLWLVPNGRARRYVLRLRRDGSARVAIPRGGSVGQALSFAQQHVFWLEQHLEHLRTRAQPTQSWLVGGAILLRGELVHLDRAAEGHPNVIRFGSESLSVEDVHKDLRPEIEQHLRRLAQRELAARVFELAAQHGFRVGRVSVRNQRSRWGSCSKRGTISLNWRLLQAPAFVRDYIITHELAHLGEMNHSARFWHLVENLCPSFMEAEKWLKKSGALLR